MTPEPPHPAVQGVVGDECDEPDARVWVEFDDPSTEGQRFRCDLTWLTSDYRCIFGAGCRGIDADRPDDGCCTLGAHFTDAEDEQRVEDIVRRLGPDEWELRDEAVAEGWVETQDGERKTRVVDGACILLNGPQTPGGGGCALHGYALARGLEPHTTKPDVCWQLPLRRTYRTVDAPDGSSYLEVSIGEYTRAGWGPGGHDLDWYCTASPAAHAGAAPLYLTSAAELVALMGRAAYDVLARHAEAHRALVRAATGPAADPSDAAPGRAPDGARLLPLLVHPATLTARERARNGSPGPAGSKGSDGAEGPAGSRSPEVGG